MIATSVLRPAWILARETTTARATWALLATAVAFELLAQGALRVALAGTAIEPMRVSAEVRWMALAAATLLLLLRVERWKALLGASGSRHRVGIVFLSALYLQCFVLLAVGVSSWMRRAGVLGIDLLSIGRIAWLACLAALLALTTFDGRSLTVAFLLLAWCVPVLGFPEASGGISSAKAMTRAAWSADGILPMLVPLLLALGLVCLERWRR
jgi:hypothetical protein